jgi:hypothetical protein
VLRHGERYAREFEAVKARSPNGIVSALEERGIRERLAQEDNSDGRSVTFAQFEKMDPAYADADSSGTVAVPMAAGGKLTRSFPNKAARQ